MKNSILLLFVSCLFFFNCSHSGEKTEDDGIQEIKVRENLSNTQKVNLSDIASDISYVMLETDEKCLIHHHMTFNCTKDYIITSGNQKANYSVCYVFDRKTGSFVRQISSVGQGPGEYTEIVNFWDGKNEQVCVLRHPYYVFFNLDGTISHQTQRFEHPIISFVAYGDLYAGYSPNPIGNNTIRIAFYDQTGAFIDSIPNNRFFERTQRMIAVSNDVWLYVFHDELYFKELFCDTLYHIKDFTLCPRYIFNTGGLVVPYEIQANPMAVIRREEYEKYISIIKILEDNHSLYFTVEYRSRLYPAIYNKMEDRLQIMPDISLLSQSSRDERRQHYGFENDLDGGLPFWPEQIVSDKEMMCVYSAEELLALDISTITDEKLKHVLNNIEEDSNPVVAIITLKH